MDNNEMAKELAFVLMRYTYKTPGELSVLEAVVGDDGVIQATMRSGQKFAITITPITEACGTSQLT